MIVFIVIAAVAVTAAAAIVTAARIAYRDGFEAGALHRRDLANLRRLQEGRTARAARELWGPEPSDWDQWAASLREDDKERLARTGELALLSRPSLTDTGELRQLVERTDTFIAQITSGAL